MRTLSVALALLVAVLRTPVAADDGTFTASVDRTTAAVGEQIEVTFTLNGSSAARNFRAPAFDNFLVLSGPNQSTNMQFINGAMSSSVTYSFVVQPRAEGKYAIGPASIEYGGRTLRTGPLTVTVTKAAAQSRPAGSQGGDVGRQIGDNLFLKVVVDKPRAYQGEQVTATYKIYTRVNVVNYNITKAPAFTGFWNEDLELRKQIQLSNEVVNGKQYRVGILKKVALFAQRSGTLEIDPMEVECLVQVQTRRRSNDIFDQFFSDPFFGGVSNVSHRVRSEPVKITVNPLPGSIPQGFTGAVGKFTMESWIDKRTTKTNEAVTLRLKIRGQGNLKLLEAPEIVLPPDIERYEPKIADNIAREGDRLAGSRTFEYLLIPRYPGEQKIPSVPFSYFDTEKKNFVTLHSPDFVLDVEKGSDLASISASGVSKEDVRLLGEDIRFIKSDPVTLGKSGETLFGSAVFYALTAGPFASFAALLLLTRRRRRLRGDVALLKTRKARKVALRRLAEAKHLLHQKKREEFYAEISKTLWGYAGDKLGLPPAELSIDAVRTALASRGVPEELAVRLSSSIEHCEFARFAPASGSHDMSSFYARTVELITAMEDKLV